MKEMNELINVYKVCWANMTKLNWRGWQFICLQESIIKKREVSFISYRWWKWYRRQSIFFLFFVWGKRNGNAPPFRLSGVVKPGDRGSDSLRRIAYLARLHQSYGLFTPHGIRTRTSTETRADTVGNNRSWFLSLSRTSVNISTWYYTFHMVPVPVPDLFPCSVNIPLEAKMWKL